MLNYVIRRLAYGLVILIGVNLITFVLFFTVNTPDDMARLSIGGKRVTPEQIEKWKAERGYNKPMLINEQEQGAAKVTNTVFWDRSVSLFLFDFGRADNDSAGDIGYQIQQRMASASFARFAGGTVSWKRSKDSTTLDTARLLKDQPELLTQYPLTREGSRRFLVKAQEG